MNECTYLGRICTDLVLNKKAMDDKENYWTRFRLAVARKRVKKEGEKDTDFFNCIAFGSAAKGICTYAKKGGRICVCGENRENNFEKDGVKYYTQLPVSIFIKDDIENIAYLPWYGVQPEEDDIVTATFGNFGFYGEWEIKG